MHMDFHKCLSEISILCLLMCLKLKVPKTEVSTFWWVPLLFLQVIIFHIIFAIIQATNLQTKLKQLFSLAIFIQSLIPKEFNSLKDLSFPLTQLLYCLFISNSDYSNSFLPGLLLRWEFVTFPPRTITVQMCTLFSCSLFLIPTVIWL